jgi:hypothetical protein
MGQGMNRRRHSRYSSQEKKQINANLLIEYMLEEAIYGLKNKKKGEAE